MRLIHAVFAFWLCAAAALAGCQKMDWWKKADAAPARSEAPDPNLVLTPEQVAELRNENTLLKAQLEDAQVRDRQLAEQVKELRFLDDQQQKQIKYLAEAPGERDRFKAQVEELKAENQLLRERIRLLQGGAPAPPAPADATQPTATSAPAGD